MALVDCRCLCTWATDKDGLCKLQGRHSNAEEHQTTFWYYHFEKVLRFCFLLSRTPSEVGDFFQVLNYYFIVFQEVIKRLWIHEPPILSPSWHKSGLLKALLWCFALLRVIEVIQSQKETIKLLIVNIFAGSIFNSLGPKLIFHVISAFITSCGKLTFGLK